ncbi:MAG TPA: c-type cytochrome [Alphaproteobacteria bacterium]|nr:c-type cytochrome [Alphaproteobacteria bacterium]
MTTKRLAVALTLLILAGSPISMGGSLRTGPSAKLVLPPYDVGEPDYEPALATDRVDTARGAKLFALNCARCHGLQGDGQGPVGYLLHPPPRDFTKGIYKIRSTYTGQLPTDRDLFRAITLGLPGSGMPAWKDKLSQEERWQLVHYLKTFLPGGWDARLRETPATPVPLPQLIPLSAESIDRGEEVYEDAGCAQCHGEQGLGDRVKPGELQDDWGFPIMPANLTQPWFFRSGSAPEDIARALVTGIAGTPMPSYQDVFEGAEEELAHLVNYIVSLAGKPPEPKLVEPTKGPTLGDHAFEKAAEIGSKLGPPDVVITVFGSAWEMWPKEIRVKQGQVVQINFWVTENGLGGPHGHGFTIDGYDDRLFGKAARTDHPLAYRFVADKAGEFEFYCSIQCDPGQVDAVRGTMGVWGHTFMVGTFIVEPR